MQITCEAVLFDNDGVLVDSHQQGTDAWRRVSDEFDMDWSVVQTEFVGVPAAETLGRLLPPDRAKAAIPRLEDLEVDYATNTPVFPGSMELLAALPTGRWTIVTSASRRLALARWHAAGITPPDTVVTADDVTRGKPDPEPFVTGARRLGVDPAGCVVFEDSPSGGRAARAAGAQVIAVGDLSWDIEPTARVQDLSAVSAATAADGSIVLTVH